MVKVGIGGFMKVQEGSGGFRRLYDGIAWYSNVQERTPVYTRGREYISTIHIRGAESRGISS